MSSIGMPARNDPGVGVPDRSEARAGVALDECSNVRRGQRGGRFGPRSVSDDHGHTACSCRTSMAAPNAGLPSPAARPRNEYGRPHLQRCTHGALEAESHTATTKLGKSGGRDNVLAVTALTVAGIALSASPAAAAGVPQEVTIDIHVERGCPAPDSCTFFASGVITDEGVVVTESIKAFALPAPVVGTAQYVRTFVGEKGSVTTRLESMIRPTDDPTIWQEQGHWVVVSATANMRSLTAGEMRLAFAASLLKASMRRTPATSTESTDWAAQASPSDCRPGLRCRSVAQTGDKQGSRSVQTSRPDGNQVVRRRIQTTGLDTFPTYMDDHGLPARRF